MSTRKQREEWAAQGKAWTDDFERNIEGLTDEQIEEYEGKVLDLNAPLPRPDEVLSRSTASGVKHRESGDRTVQYTDGIGISICKPELQALAQFCGEADRLAFISFRVANGKTIAWAVDGHNAAYLHGDAWDGKGKPSKSECDFQLAAEMAETIARSMTKETEVFLKTDKKLHLFEAEVKDIESGVSRARIDLDGHVAQQIDLSLPNYFPTRPPRESGEVPGEMQTFSWGALALLKKVCAAACTDVVRTFVNSNPTHPIYCEIDTPARLNDDEQPRWICVLAPSKAAADAVSNTDDQPDPAGGDEE